MVEKPFFPMFIDLSKKKVVVIGGGRIAGRRIRTLLSFAGQICVIAPEVTEEIEGYIKEGRITHLKTRYAPELIRDADLCWRPRMIRPAMNRRQTSAEDVGFRSMWPIKRNCAISISRGPRCAGI